MIPGHNAAVPYGAALRGRPSHKYWTLQKGGGHGGPPVYKSRMYVRGSRFARQYLWVINRKNPLTAAVSRVGTKRRSRIRRGVSSRIRRRALEKVSSQIS